MAIANGYNVFITGDCQSLNVGVIDLYPTFGTPPYTVDWVLPSLGIDPLVTNSTRTGLSAGTYNIYVTDSTTPVNQYLEINLQISSGICLNLEVTSDTTCGNDNGSLIVTATTTTLPIVYNLYGYLSGTSYLVSSTTAFTNSLPYFGLSAGTYYVEAFDNGGCSGSTGTCVIKDSTNFDYGFYVVNNSPCINVNNGAIYITGLTGNPPYTYTWTSGQTTQVITGLTDGIYTVTVTDFYGCTVTKSTTVSTAPTLGIVGFSNTSPTCFSSDGIVTVNISGGTPPYYYQFSNGSNNIQYGQSITYVGLSTGFYTVIVTDAALCSVTGSTSIYTPNSFQQVIVEPTNSQCSDSSGSILVTVVGASPPITFELTDSLNNTTTIVGGPSAFFTGLTSGNYNLVVSNSGPCVYTQTITIQNIYAFNISTSTTGTTCGLNNGIVEVSVDTPGIYNYQLGSALYTNTTNQSVIFDNLQPGYYVVTVSDANPDTLPCVQNYGFIISGSENVNFTLSNTGCGTGSEGTITTLITGGVPPFTYSWTPSVAPQTGIYITGLTAGTYTLVLTDSNGCSATKSTTIVCSSGISTYAVFNVCQSEFTETAGEKLELLQMLNNGYYALTSGETGCSLTSADFTLLVNVGGTAYTNTFYTSTSLLDVPSVSTYVSVLSGILNTIPGMGTVNINTEFNTIQLTTDCELTLADKNVTIQVVIDYNICCDA
jgi:hypothetical protein